MLSGSFVEASFLLSKLYAKMPGLPAAVPEHRGAVHQHHIMERGLASPCRTEGFDHGAGHPLLLLCNTKAPNYSKNNAFNDLAHYSEWPQVADAVIKALPNMPVMGVHSGSPSWKKRESSRPYHVSQWNMFAPSEAKVGRTSSRTRRGTTDSRCWCCLGCEAASRARPHQHGVSRGLAGPGTCGP
jgi:hypothetical protein